MRRFILFHGDRWYPQGGAKDFNGFYYHLDQAIEQAKTDKITHRWHWAHIFDVETGEIVWEEGTNALS